MANADIFISYSHQDEAWKERLKVALDVLKHHGYFSVWEDSQIAMGADWNNEIESAIASARVAILLVSNDFLASDFVQQKEIPELLERRRAEGFKVIPVLLEPCSWKFTKLAAIQGATKGNKSLLEMAEVEQKHEIARLVEEVYTFLSKEKITTTIFEDSLYEIKKVTSKEKSTNKKTDMRKSTYYKLIFLLVILIGVWQFRTDLVTKISSIGFLISQSEKDIVPGAGRFIDNGDGTITDKLTRLMWKTCSEGQIFDIEAQQKGTSPYVCPGQVKNYTWKEANKKFADNIQFLGYSDWRLPDVDELRTLVWCSNGTKSIDAIDGCDGKGGDLGGYKEPTIDQDFFPNTALNYYISSTIRKSIDAESKSSTSFWKRNFRDGSVFGANTIDTNGVVRLVRGIDNNKRYVVPFLEKNHSMTFNYSFEAGVDGWSLSSNEKEKNDYVLEVSDTVSRSGNNSFNIKSISDNASKSYIYNYLNEDDFYKLKNKKIHVFSYINVKYIKGSVSLRTNLFSEEENNRYYLYNKGYAEVT